MSEDYAVESIDTGLRLPILYNVVASAFNILISVLYIIILARVLPPTEFLAYTSIFTFYTLLTPLLTRVVQWSSRDYVRFGDEVKPLFSGLYTLTILVGVFTAPTLIHFFIKALSIQELPVIILYGIAIITYFYTLNLVSLVAPRFFNLTSLISMFTRFTLVLTVLLTFGSISYIIPLSMEIVGYTFGIASSLLLTRGRISPSLFKPYKPSLKYTVRIVKLSIINYVNMLRANLGNIHYFIAFFMGLADILVNSLWIVYRVLNWGRSFFRGFFIVVYSRQFYQRMSKYDFKSYLNILLYLIIPMFMISLVMHKPITSLFNPKYMVYSQLIPIAILLVLLESLRVTFLRLTFGGETIDAKMDDIKVRDILSTNFFKISVIQLKAMTISTVLLAFIGVYFVFQGYTLYIPYLFLVFFILEAITEVILMYRKASSYMEMSVDKYTPIYLVLASIPSNLYLYYVGAYNIVVKDIFPDALPLISHIAIAFLIYIVFSLSSRWVRSEVRGLINYINRIRSSK